MAQQIEMARPIAKQFKMVESAPDQSGQLQTLLAMNPNAKDIFKQLQNFQSCEAAFYSFAEQKGCSKEEAKDILAQLRQTWSSL